eukprot:gi/632986072/ref/XP_007910033.1/ PREDICTED: UPF0722 protein C11orf88 homolog [Callorhinchus milii]
MAEDPEAAADGLSGFTVFAASPREDVAYAKVFWNSLSLQPPLESRLVSGDITQRLRVAPAVGSDRCRCRLSSADKKARQKEIAFEMKMKAEQKAVYLEKAKKRKEILVLIQQRREQSIQRERVYRPYRPQRVSEPRLRPTSPDFNKEVEETYQALRMCD